MAGERTRLEEIRVVGGELVRTVRELVHEGNVRRIVVMNERGETYLEVPLTVGVVGAVLLPVWAALGALAALATGFRIRIERVERPAEPDGAPTP